MAADSGPPSNPVAPTISFALERHAVSEHQGSASRIIEKARGAQSRQLDRRPNRFGYARPMESRAAPDPATGPHPPSEVGACAGTEAGLAAIPPAYWLIPLAVSVLRTLPFLAQQWFHPPPGKVFVGVSYLPTDFLAYLGFCRQVGHGTEFLMVNPFTTEVQSPRYVLLFHWLVGAVSWLTHIPPNWVFELSRLPLLCGLFWTLWHFLAPYLPRKADRVWAALLIGFAGGIEGSLQFLDEILPSAEANTFLEDTASLLGWNVFAAAYNPLLIAALISSLWVLRDILAPPAKGSYRQALKIGLGIVLIHLIHPYSALVVLAVAGALPVLAFVCRPSIDYKAAFATLTGAGLALVIMAVLGWWQCQEPAYAQPASRTLGSRSLPPFWYPITLGATGLLAIRGAVSQSFPSERRFPLVAWIAVVVLLSSSPVLNGYKFAFHLFIPVCILAAPAATEVYQRFRSSGTVQKLIPAGILGLVFGSCVMVTFESLVESRQVGVIFEDQARLVRLLALKPSGNVLCPDYLGNIIPAFTAHRVWVGHWFLTPRFLRRAGEYDRLTTSLAALADLQRLLESQRIRYLILPDDRAEPLRASIGPRVRERVKVGSYELWVIDQ